MSNQQFSKLYKKVTYGCMTGNAAFIYAVMCDASQLEKGVCFLSLEYICETCNVSKKTVTNTLRVFEYLGLAKKVGFSSSKTTCYQMPEPTEEIIKRVQSETKGQGRWDKLAKEIYSIKENKPKNLTQEIKPVIVSTESETPRARYLRMGYNVMTKEERERL